MTQVNDVMSKGCEWVAPETSVTEAARIMAQKDIGFLPVGENDRLVGMVTDRDLTVRALAQGTRDGEEVLAPPCQRRSTILFCAVPLSAESLQK